MLFGFCIMTALLKLSQISGPVSSRLQSICLSEQAATSPFASGPCIATGWGQVSRTGSLTAKLLEARIPLQESAVCRSKYGNSVPIRAGHLCAGHLDGSTGTCVVSGSGWYGCAGVLGVCVSVCVWCWQLPRLSCVRSAVHEHSVPWFWTLHFHNFSGHRQYQMVSAVCLYWNSSFCEHCMMSAFI